MAKPVQPWNPFNWTVRDVENAAVTASAFAVVAQSVSAYYDALATKGELKAQALNLEHQARMSRLAAREAEEQAQGALKAGADQVGRATREYGAVAAEHRVSTGARGVSAGVGSTAEAAASIELAKEVDKLTINRNAVRAAGAARMGRVNAENAALLSGVSAQNLRRSAGAIRPMAAATGSLLSGTAGVAKQWTEGRRWDAWAERQGGG